MLDQVLPHPGRAAAAPGVPALAGALGHDQVDPVAELAGLWIPTIIRRGGELDDQPDPYGRHRREGRGPKRAGSRAPNRACFRRWTSSSTPTPDSDPDRRCARRPSPPGAWPRRLARRACRYFSSTPMTGFSTGRVSTAPHRKKPWSPPRTPRRGARFRFLDQQNHQRLAAEQTIVSVDTHQEELGEQLRPMVGFELWRPIRRAARGRCARLPRSRGRQGGPVSSL